ncbi:MAG: helix-turn-helix domain-containing protein [Lachnospiraceae bacterium]|nr:helix-turn-helix domain-containing protein [Lachnospiraceae bacterium]
MEMQTSGDQLKVLTVRELGNVLHIGRDKAYALIKSKGFPSICIGNRYIVTEQALNEWLHQYEHKTYIV